MESNLKNNIYNFLIIRGVRNITLHNILVYITQVMESFP